MCSAATQFTKFFLHVVVGSYLDSVFPPTLPFYTANRRCGSACFSPFLLFFSRFSFSRAFVNTRESRNLCIFLFIIAGIREERGREGKDLDGFFLFLNLNERGFAVFGRFASGNTRVLCECGFVTRIRHARREIVAVFMSCASADDASRQTRRIARFFSFFFLFLRCPRNESFLLRGTIVPIYALKNSMDFVSACFISNVL